MSWLGNVYLFYSAEVKTLKPSCAKSVFLNWTHALEGPHGTTPRFRKNKHCQTFQLPCLTRGRAVSSVVTQSQTWNFVFWVLNFKGNLNFDCCRQSFLISIFQFVLNNCLLFLTKGSRDKHKPFRSESRKDISVIARILKNKSEVRHFWVIPLFFSSNWRMSKVQNSQVRNEFTSNISIYWTFWILKEQKRGNFEIEKLTYLHISNSGDLLVTHKY